jgi:hypothetical protein
MRAVLDSVAHKRTIKGTAKTASRVAVKQVKVVIGKTQ